MDIRESLDSWKNQLHDLAKNLKGKVPEPLRSETAIKFYKIGGVAVGACVACITFVGFVLEVGPKSFSNSLQSFVDQRFVKKDSFKSGECYYRAPNQEIKIIFSEFPDEEFVLVSLFQGKLIDHEIGTAPVLRTVHDSFRGVAGEFPCGVIDEEFRVIDVTKMKEDFMLSQQANIQSLGISRGIFLTEVVDIGEPS